MTLLASPLTYIVRMTFAVLLVSLLTNCQQLVPTVERSENWPQSAGPNGSWKVTTDQPIPHEFSVRTGQNIIWTMDLLEVGQGGITIWGDHIFLTVMKPLYEVPEKKERQTHTILALCIDAKSQEILWQREIVGTTKSPYFYGFSDSTTPAPVTDGEKVWFFNASGKIVCYDFAGNPLWERAWKPVDHIGKTHYPFNKQFEPILHGDLLINMESYMSEDGTREYGWNYLYGLDKITGEVRWISEDGVTHYCTPVFNTTADGVPAMLIGRGAHHKVPEAPMGYSLVDLRNGTTLWRYETDEGMAMYNATWTPKKALWFTERENVIHQVDAQTGELIDKISLVDQVTVHTYDTTTQQYTRLENHHFSDTSFVFPAWYSNIIVDDKCYFMCFKPTRGYRMANAVPEYSFARVDLKTQKVEYLEVPVQYDLVNDEKQYLWKQDLKTETKNIRELDVAFDKRSQRDGWVWNFNGNPIVINNKLFYTTMSGMVYCFDTSADAFDENALLSVSDLGPKGKTWTLNAPSYADGKLYHRTSKQLICVGK